MITALHYKIDPQTIKAAKPVGYGFIKRRQMPHDRMAAAMDAVRNADSVKRYMQMYKAGEIFVLNKN